MTINELQNVIIEDFLPIEDWFDKYEYLIDLGKKLKPIDPRLKTEKYQVHGCQSQVWIHSERKADCILLSADSDSLITRGILSLLLRVLNMQPPQDIVGSDLYFIKEIGLSTNLSPSRANGLALMVQKIQRDSLDILNNQ